SFLLLFGFQWPTAADASMLVGSGLANALAQYFWTQALRLAPTAAVSPFYYFLLVWALVIGFAVWGDVPTAGLLIGAGLVVGSGLLLLGHEAKSSPAKKPGKSRSSVFMPPRSSAAAVATSRQ